MEIISSLVGCFVGQLFTSLVGKSASSKYNATFHQETSDTNY
jgi:hypothetical protein